MNHLIVLVGIALVMGVAALAEAVEPHARAIGRQLVADVRSALGR